MMTLGNLFASPSIYAVTQNIGTQVGIETGLKAVGRPGFIILDKNIDAQTKKYSAMKELLFQLTCLAVSLGVVIPVFKKGSFGIAKKLFKDEAVFKAFKNSDEFKVFRTLAEDKKLEKLAQINNAKGTNYELKDINEHLGKGAIEVSSILGSVLGLSALSPMISRPFVRPALKMLGMDKKEGQPTEIKNNQPKEIAVA